MGSVLSFIQSFFNDFSKPSANMDVASVASVAKLDVSVLRTKYFSDPDTNGRIRLFMFDYDGTLTPIVNDPNAALPSEKALAALRHLASDKHNSVWIISGRDSAFLEKHWGDIPNLGLSAEHGCFLRAPGATEWQTLVNPEELAAWQATVCALFDAASKEDDGTLTERKKAAVTWHYRNAINQEFGVKKAMEMKEHLEKELAGRDVEIMEGKCNLEVRPHSVSKGEVVKQIVADQANGSSIKMIVCAGDDRTDEDMFNALTTLSAPSTPDGNGNATPLPRVSREDVFSVHVGPKDSKTSARFYVETPELLVNALHDLLEN